MLDSPKGNNLMAPQMSDRVGGRSRNKTNQHDLELPQSSDSPEEGSIVGGPKTRTFMAPPGQYSPKIEIPMSIPLLPILEAVDVGQLLDK